MATTKNGVEVFQRVLGLKVKQAGAELGQAQVKL